jgi:hypothetical protein
MWKLMLLDKLVAQVPDKVLGDDEIHVQLLEGLTVEEPVVNKETPDFTFALDAGVKASIEAFNSPGDVDTAGVVGDGAKADDKGLAPVLLLDKEPKQGWLKYVTEVRAKATGGKPLPFVSLKADGEVRVLVADYRAHALTEEVKKALRADLDGPLRLPTHRNNLQRLAPGDALTFQARGTLKASVTLQWADVFSTNVHFLSGLVPTSTLIAVSLDAGASLGASMELTDDYLVIFSRPEAGRLHVAVKKAVARQAGLTGRLGVSVTTLKDQSSGERVTSAVLSGLLGMPVKKFEDMLTQLEEKKLGELELKALRLALDQLGLQEVEANPAGLKRAWLDLKEKKLPERLDALASEKLEAGFSYEYSRLAEGTTLLALTCSDAQAAELHPHLLLGDLERVMGYVREQGLALERCWLEELTTTREAWGFSLKLGAWAVGGQDTKVLKQVVQRNSVERDAPRRVSFLGTRAYTGSLLEPWRSWTVDFKADMADFRPQPTTVDLDYGLYLLLHSHERKRGERELRELVDEAILWRVLDDADEERFLTQLHEAAGVRRGQDMRVETRLELKLDDVLFREVLQRSADPDLHKVFSRALARALPWYPVHCREMPEVRESVYAPLWEAFLAQGGWKPDYAAKTAAQNLRNNPFVGDFYRVEGFLEDNRVREGMVTFAEVIKKNPGTADKWRDFRAALLRLRNDIAAHRPPESLPAVFEELEDSWGTAFHLKATGAFFLELALRSAKGLSMVERTFTVTLPEKKQQLVFSKTR